MNPSVNYHDDLLRRLKNPRYAVGYLNACLQDGDDGVSLLALRDVAHVHGGLRSIAGKTHLNRKRLFRMLSKKGNPRLRNLRQLIGTFGFKPTLQAA
jgi:probable addiction module antidote protein